MFPQYTSGAKVNTGGIVKRSGGLDQIWDLRFEIISFWFCDFDTVGNIVCVKLLVPGTIESETVEDVILSQINIGRKFARNSLKLSADF